MKQFLNQQISQATDITYGTVVLVIVSVLLFIAGTILFINKKMA